MQRPKNRPLQLLVQAAALEAPTCKLESILQQCAACTFWQELLAGGFCRTSFLLLRRMAAYGLGLPTQYALTFAKHSAWLPPHLFLNSIVSTSQAPMAPPQPEKGSSFHDHMVFHQARLTRGTLISAQSPLRVVPVMLLRSSVRQVPCAGQQQPVPLLSKHKCPTIASG